MYFITKEEDLHGRTIAFTHFARFAEASVIVTTDKGVFVSRQENDEEDTEIHIFNEPRARHTS